MQMHEAMLCFCRRECSLLDSGRACAVPSAFTWSSSFRPGDQAFLKVDGGLGAVTGNAVDLVHPMEMLG